MRDANWFWEYEIETWSDFHSGIVIAKNIIDAICKIKEAYGENDRADIIEIHTLRAISEGILDFQQEGRSLKIPKEKAQP